MAWKILFFQTPRGEKVVKEFIKSLGTITIAKVGHTISLLEEHGPYLGMPHSKKLTRELYELRVRGKQEVRIIYAFIKMRIYLLHGFKKKTQKTPRREISIALERLENIT